MDVLLDIFNEQLTMWSDARTDAASRGDYELLMIATKHITQLVLQAAPLGYYIVEDHDGVCSFAKTPV